LGTAAEIGGGRGAVAERPQVFGAPWPLRMLLEPRVDHLAHDRGRGEPRALGDLPDHVPVRPAGLEVLGHGLMLGH
jgi:hypothetical protein